MRLRHLQSVISTVEGQNKFPQRFPRLGVGIRKEGWTDRQMEMAEAGLW